MTLYAYKLDNTDGSWRKFPKTIVDVYEIWDGNIPDDICVGRLPDEWIYDERIDGPSPDPKFC